MSDNGQFTQETFNAKLIQEMKDLRELLDREGWDTPIHGVPSVDAMIKHWVVIFTDGQNDITTGDAPDA